MIKIDGHYLIRSTLLAFVVALLFAFPLFAEEEYADFDEEPVSAFLLAENQSIQPGKAFWIAIQLKIDEGWHTYWKNPGEIGMPISVEWELPDGYSVTPLFWPTPKRYRSESITGYGYEGEVMLLAKVTPPADGAAHAKFSATVEWLACSSETCLPGGEELSLSLPVYHTKPRADSVAKTAIEEAKKKIPTTGRGHVAATRKQDLVEVVVEVANGEERDYRATFFPEEEGLFDGSCEATISKSSEMAGCYVVALKELEGIESHPSNVKGVLVINERYGDELVDALEIDLSIGDSSDDSKIISMVDSKEKKSVAVRSDASDEESNPFDGGFLFYLVTAFFGGILLNFMPCVLPVISLKIMSFVNMAGEERGKILLHGTFFSIGVLISFWILAAALLLLQAYGHIVGWGFQLQQPFVVSILAIVIWVFSLSMFGLFEFGTSLSAMAGQAEVRSKKNSESLLSSFFSGVLATAVATPCTGPLLGPAVGFAVTQSSFVAMLIFTALGLGMAAPYLLLSAFPQFIKFIPKPGNWMITFKEVTGFIMVAVVIWLLWVFAAQTDSLALFLLLSSLLIISIGCWVYGKWSSPIRSKRIRTLGLLASITLIALGANIAYQASTKPVTTLDDRRPVSFGDEHPTEVWVDFDAALLEELRHRGRPVLVDFTAKWCLICQANHLVLSFDEVDRKLAEHGVVKMKADWTKHDPDITRFLKKFGRNGVPLYLLYSGDPHSPPEILPQMLTPEVVLHYLEKMKKPVAMGEE